MNRRFRAGARTARLLLLLPALAVLLAGTAPAWADITVGFVQPDSAVVPDSFTVMVSVDAQATDLRGFSMVLQFDPDAVSLLSVDAGSLLVNAGCPYFLQWLNAPQVASGDSTIVFDGASLGCSASGPGDIVKLTFRCDEVAMSPISCVSVEMRDSLNQHLDSTCTPGTLGCESPIAVEATTWGRVKSWYRGPGSPR